MWVVYHKFDRGVVGMSSHSPVELDKAVALEEVVKSLGESRDLDDFDAVRVDDPMKIRALFESPSRARRVVEETGRPARVENADREVFSLVLATEAGDPHPLDGVRVIPADGKTVAEVRVRKVDREGRAMTRARDADILWLRTDHGAILDTKGDLAMSLTLSRGEGAFQLRSGTDWRRATVDVHSADVQLGSASIEIEFGSLPERHSGAREEAVTTIADLPDAFQHDLQRAADILRGEGIDRIYLFGSLAAGSASEDSDIDLIVDGISQVKVSVLRRKLNRDLGRRVDVVHRESAFARHVFISARPVRIDMGGARGRKRRAPAKRTKGGSAKK